MTEETADGIVKLMEMVEQDMRNDVNEYDGKPFDGRTSGGSHWISMCGDSGNSKV